MRLYNGDFLNLNEFLSLQKVPIPVMQSELVNSLLNTCFYICVCVSLSAGLYYSITKVELYWALTTITLMMDSISLIPLFSGRLMSGTINEVKKKKKTNLKWSGAVATSHNPNFNFLCSLCMCVLAPLLLKQEIISLSLLWKHHSIAKEAFERGTNPIIIDNTNMQGWEMKPYVAQVSQLASSFFSTETDILH